MATIASRLTALYTAMATKLNAAYAAALKVANNLSDLPSPSTARTNLGLGTAATQNIGTSGATVPLLNGANLTFGGVVSFASTVTLAGDAALPLQPVTLQQLQNVQAAYDRKPACLVASTGNLSLSGLAAIDGVTPTAGARVLVKDQTTPSQNGIYVAASGAWSRATDMNTWDEVPNANLWVQQGATNHDKAFVCTSDEGGTLGTTAITWTQWGGTGAFQAASNVLTALASVSYTSGSMVPVFTGPSTIGLVAFTPAGIGALASGANTTQSVYALNLFSYNATSTHYANINNVDAAATADRNLNLNLHDATRILSLSGDLNVTANASVSGTNTGDQTDISAFTTGTLPDARLSNVITAAGPIGDGTHVPVITFDAHGRLTAVTSAAIGFPAAPVSSVAGRTGAVTLAVGDVSGAAALTGATFTGPVNVSPAPSVAATLNVTADGATPSIGAIRFSADTSGPVIGLSKAGGSVASPAYPPANSIVGRYSAGIFNGTTAQNTGRLDFTCIAATPGATDSQGRLSVVLTTAGTTTLSTIMQMDWTAGISLSTTLSLYNVNFAALPTASTKGRLVTVANMEGGAGALAMDSGTAWGKVSDRNVQSFTGVDVTVTNLQGSQALDAVALSANRKATMFAGSYPGQVWKLSRDGASGGFVRNVYQADGTTLIKACADSTFLHLFWDATATLWRKSAYGSL